MSFFPRQKPDTDSVDPGDSTYIIHKRILKGTRARRTRRGDSQGVYPQKLALINGNWAGLDVRIFFGAGTSAIYR
jgi:hypothetical protein